MEEPITFKICYWKDCFRHDILNVGTPPSDETFEDWVNNHIKKDMEKRGVGNFNEIQEIEYKLSDFKPWIV